MDLKSSRSKQYQHLLHETNYSAEGMHIIDQRYSYEKYNELHQQIREDIELLIDLDAQLQAELWILIYTTCTPIQILTCQQIYMGLTQWQAADAQGKEQSTIHKCLRGGDDQHRGKKYGGVGTKIAKELRYSENIKKIMKQMWLIDDRAPNPHYVAFKNTFPYHEFVHWIHN